MVAMILLMFLLGSSEATTAMPGEADGTGMLILSP